MKYTMAGRRFAVHDPEHIKHRYVKTQYRLHRYRSLGMHLLIQKNASTISPSQESFPYAYVVALCALSHVASCADNFCWSNTLARMMVGNALSNGERCRTAAR